MVTSRTQIKSFIYNTGHTNLGFSDFLEPTVEKLFRAHDVAVPLWYRISISDLTFGRNPIKSDGTMLPWMMSGYVQPTQRAVFLFDDQGYTGPQDTAHLMSTTAARYLPFNRPKVISYYKNLHNRENASLPTADVWSDTTKAMNLNEFFTALFGGSHRNHPTRVCHDCDLWGPTDDSYKEDVSFRVTCTMGWELRGFNNTAFTPAVDSTVRASPVPASPVRETWDEVYATGDPDRMASYICDRHPSQDRETVFDLFSSR